MSWLSKHASSVANPLSLGLYDVLSKKKGSPTDPNLSKEAQFAALVEEIKKSAPEDQAKIMQEVDKQKELGTGYAGDYASKRAAMLDKLSGVLVNQQNRQLEQEVPHLAEQANLKGIFRSTGLGNSISREAGNLASTTSSELMKQGIANEGANIEDLKGINDAYLGGRNSALSRNFSLEDMARSAHIAKTTGQLIQPAPVKTPSAKGTGAIQGGLGGAAAGATAGGPVGAAVGTTIGTIGGGQLGGK